MRMLDPDCTHFLIPKHELQLIHITLLLVVDALESDANVEDRRIAFEHVQNLYSPGRFLALQFPIIDETENAETRK